MNTRAAPLLGLLAVSSAGAAVARPGSHPRQVLGEVLAALPHEVAQEDQLLVRIAIEMGARMVRRSG